MQTQIPNIIPVILAGGKGTRLWPVSREEMPKQFCRLAGDKSLFQKSVLRVFNEQLFRKPVVVTNASSVSTVKTQLAEIGVEAASIIGEPTGRDTAAAIALASIICRTNANLLVMPSDHEIADTEMFQSKIQLASTKCHQDEQPGVFGITPDRPDSNFGYIRVIEKSDATPTKMLQSFIEKPDMSTAEELIKEPGVYWNAGIFMLPNYALADLFQEHASDIYEQARMAVIKGICLGNIFLPQEKAFSEIRAISFDYAIMENTKDCIVVPLENKWSDLGSWRAIWELGNKDEHHNLVSGDTCLSETNNSLVISDGPKVAVAGLEDLVVVANRDAVLVTHRENTGVMKGLVNKVRAQQPELVTRHSGETRPWGSFDSLHKGAQHQVKSIKVTPGGKLSLQYHHHRSEHWVVVKGTATVTVGEEVMDLSPGEKVFIPQGAVHRLANHTDAEVEIIEVQIGDYLGEDDIVRVEDVYGRDDKPSNEAAALAA